LIDRYQPNIVVNEVIERYLFFPFKPNGKQFACSTEHRLPLPKYQSTTLPEVGPVEIRQASRETVLGYLEYLNHIPLLKDRKNRDLPLSETDSLVIKGWAVDSHAENVASEIDIEIDGLRFPALYGLTRPDLASLNQRYIRGGFSCEIPMQCIGRGDHSLTARVGAHDGHCFYELKDAVTFRIT